MLLYKEKLARRKFKGLSAMGQAVLRSQNGIAASLPTPSQFSTGCVQMCSSFLNTHKIFLNFRAGPYLMQATLLLLSILLWSLYKIPLKDGLMTATKPRTCLKKSPWLVKKSLQYKLFSWHSLCILPWVYCFTNWLSAVLPTQDNGSAPPQVLHELYVVVALRSY